MDKDLDFRKTCRTCLTQETTLYLIEEFANKFDENLRIYQMITECTTVKISLYDDLPQTVCDNCVQKLNIIKAFRKKCEESDIFLRQYITSKTQAKEHKTSDCDEEIQQNQASKEKETDDETNEPKACDICLRIFQTDILLKRHLKTHKNANKSDDELDKIFKTKHVCKLCKKTFTQQYSLVVHMKRHRGQKDFKCHLCPKAFTTSGSLNLHIKTHTGEKPFECNQCKKCFITKDSLRKHQRRHSGEISHLCSVCGKGFGAASTLMVHMRIHSGVKPLKCNICDMRFAAYASLSFHMRKHSGDTAYLCSHCGKGFKSSTDLTVHTRKHTGECPFKCDLCDKRFRTSYLRTVHQRSHTGERPAKCYICNKSYSPGHLSIHIRTHLKDKPHSCTVCNRSFNFARDLQSHMYIHSGQRPHICPQCGKGFNRRNNLNKHLKIHSGIKPHVCEVCKFAFSTNSELKNHFRSHTGERPYHCSECDKKFASSSGLARHRRRQHAQKKNKTSEVFSDQNSVLNSSNNELFVNKTNTNTAIQDNIIVEQFTISENSIVTSQSDKLTFETLQNVQTDVLKFDNIVPISEPQILEVAAPMQNKMSELPNSYVSGFHDEDKVRKMKYNPLGQTGLKVSQVSLGTAGFSWLYGTYKEEECIKTVHEALKSGINYIDTAPWYGQGSSEEILGKALQGIPRNSYYIATKVGRYEADPKKMFDFSAEKTRWSVENSLQKLGLDYVDIIQVHDIEFAHDLDQVVNECLPVLEEMLKVGKARYIGITGYPVSVLKECVQRSKTHISTVLSYARMTLIDDTLNSYMMYFNTQGIGVINAAAPSMGLLTNNGPQSWHPASQEIKDVCKQVAEYCKSQNVELCRLAMNYTYSQKGVATNVAGMNNMDHLNSNLEVYYNGLTDHEKEVLNVINERFFSKLTSRHWEGVEIANYRKTLGL